MIWSACWIGLRQMFHHVRCMMRCATKSLRSMDAYRFKTEKWQKHFGAQDWYQTREDYTDEWLSPVAQANVKLLIEMKANKVGCMD